MGKKLLLQLLILLLGFSYLLSSETRSLVNVNYDSASVEIVEQVNNRKMLIMVEKESLKEGKEIDKNDYPGSGANDHHDPKNPGKG